MYKRENIVVPNIPNPEFSKNVQRFLINLYNGHAIDTYDAIHITGVKPSYLLEQGLIKVIDSQFYTLTARGIKLAEKYIKKNPKKRKNIVVPNIPNPITTNSKWIHSTNGMEVSVLKSNNKSGVIRFKNLSGGPVYELHKSAFLRQFVPSHHNPTHHFPKTEKGRPGTAKYKRLYEEVFPGLKKGRPRVQALWKADLFSSSGFIDSIIGQGTKSSAMAEAAGFVGKTYNNSIIARVQLNGPYADLDAMEADVTEDETDSEDSGQFVGAYAGLNELVNQNKIARKRGRPRKEKPIKVVSVNDIPSEIASAHAPKRGRGRPRKHPVNKIKFGLGQRVEIRQGQLKGRIATIVEIRTTRDHINEYLLDTGSQKIPYLEYDLQGLRGRPRK